MNSVVIISSAALRERFAREITTLHLDTGNIFGHITFQATYQYGAPWLEAMLHYLENNIRFAADFIRKEIPDISLFIPECSFLLWLDFIEKSKKPVFASYYILSYNLYYVNY